MHIILALDKFKGTFSAQEACDLLAAGIWKIVPEAKIFFFPMADGGEGSGAILSQSLGCDTQIVETINLFNQPISANIFWEQSRRIALIESSQTLGAPRALVNEDTLMQSNSEGLGALLHKAIALRPKELWLGIGGTMIADAGWGILSAFGLEAYDKKNIILRPCLSNMDKINRINFSKPIPEFLKKVKFTALCDVRAPASGKGVTLASFLRQKGAKSTTIPLIEKKIIHFWTALKKSQPEVLSLTAPATGAGGGIVIGLSALFSNLQCLSGADAIAEKIGLEQNLNSSDLVIVGEGCLDNQTLSGKAVSTVCLLARKHQTRAIGVFGRVKGDVENLQAKLGLDSVHLLMKPGQTKVRNLIKYSQERFLQIGEQIATQYLNS